MRFGKLPRRGHVLLHTCILALALGCATQPPAAAQRCTPNFPYTEGWLGADAAYSLPLDRGRTLWLFGDTFVGAPGQTSRAGATFIHNSVAVSRCTEAGVFEVDYAWRPSAAGPPRAFFDTGEEGRYWWLFDGFTYAGNLYVGLLGVRKSAPQGDLNLPFELTGMKLARVPNALDPPAAWSYDVLPLSEDENAFPGSAMVVHGEYVYFFTFLEEALGARPRTLTRLPLIALAQPTPSEAFETLGQAGHWQPGFAPASALIVMDDSATEMSVNYDVASKQWVAVYSPLDAPAGSSAAAQTGEVLLRTAPKLEGPWSRPERIFRIPELQKTSPGYVENTFCYAAKEHPEFASNESILLSYVCNLYTPTGGDGTATLKRLVREMQLYRPQVVEVPNSLGTDN